MKNCPVSAYCGGCQFQGIDYDSQLKHKQKYISDLLGDFHHVEDIIGMDDPANYRNKMQISFAYDDQRNIISGYYVPKTHMIVPVKECMLCDTGINRIYSSVRKILLKYRISVFDERIMKGCMRHLLIRSSNLNEYMVVLVTGSVTINNKDLIVRDIIRFNPEVKTIIHNVNSTRTSAILGSRSQILYGNGYITDELCDMRFRISAESFFQVNKRQTERLYNTAIDLADLKNNELVLDAYCGTGTIGMTVSRYAEKVIGVELNRSAIKDARNNARINNVNNIEFIADDAGRYMEKISRSKQYIDTVIMDPPRSGSNMKFMSAMVKMEPEKIIYISCNPETLKKDLKYLGRYYRIMKIQPVDMFPYTQHVETVCLLTHKG